MAWRFVSFFASAKTRNPLPSPGLRRSHGVEIMPVQLGCDPVAAQLQSAFAASDLKSEKLKALGNVHDPGFFRLSVTPSFPRIFVARAKAE